MTIPTLSVSFADSSPRGRAKALLQIGAVSKETAGGENPLPAELYCKTFIASSVTPYSTGW